MLDKIQFKIDYNLHCSDSVVVSSVTDYKSVQNYQTEFGEYEGIQILNNTLINSLYKELWDVVIKHIHYNTKSNIMYDIQSEIRNDKIENIMSGIAVTNLLTNRERLVAFYRRVISNMAMSPKYNKKFLLGDRFSISSYAEAVNLHQCHSNDTISQINIDTCYDVDDRDSIQLVSVLWGRLKFYYYNQISFPDEDGYYFFLLDENFSITRSGIEIDRSNGQYRVSMRVKVECGDDPIKVQIYDKL